MQFKILDGNISNHELLTVLSAIVTFVAIFLIGMSIAVSVSNHQQDIADKYRTTAITKSKSRVKYLAKTDYGRIGVDNGIIQAVDGVKLAELNGEYSFVYAEREDYNMHTETYTTTDSKGNTTTQTRTYWSWDEEDSKTVSTIGYLLNGNIELRHADAAKFEQWLHDPQKYVNPQASGAFTYGNGNFDNDYYYPERDVRYHYEVIPLKFKASLFANTTDKADVLKPWNGNKSIELLTEKATHKRNRIVDNVYTPGIGTCLLLAILAGGLAYVVGNFVWMNYV